MLHLDVSLLQQPVLPQDVSLLQLTMLSLGVSLCLFYTSPYCPQRCLACASPGRICSTAVSAVPGGVLHLRLYLGCLSTRACAALMRVCVYKSFCAAPRRVCFYDPVLHLCVSVNKNFVLHLDMSLYMSRCCYCACLSTRALCRTLTCLSTRAGAATVRVCLL